MRYFKITFKEEGTTDSMTFAAESEKGAWDQLDSLTGGVPRNQCEIEHMSEEEFMEENPTEDNFDSSLNEDAT